MYISICKQYQVCLAVVVFLLIDIYFYFCMVQPNAGLLTSGCGGTFSGTRPSCVSCDSRIVNVIKKNKKQKYNIFQDTSNISCLHASSRNIQRVAFIKAKSIKSLENRLFIIQRCSGRSSPTHTCVYLYKCEPKKGDFHFNPCFALVRTTEGAVHPAGRHLPTQHLPGRKTRFFYFPHSGRIESPFHAQCWPS